MTNNFLLPGLSDLCVSRSSFKWGVPVNFDEKHVIYVWVDALSNYITALGYSPNEKGELYKKYWPCDVHVIGKDILRFHTIYWPIFLLALGEELPKSIFGHPWLLFGEDKMSKSRGNAIYADELADIIGVDGVRYYLLSEMPYAQDGTITKTRVFEQYNAELANNLGNLVNRTIAMTQKYFGGIMPKERKKAEIDAQLIDAAKNCKTEMIEKLEQFKCADAIGAVMNLAKRANKYIDETTPWVLGKDENETARLASVLFNLLETVRYLAVLLTPFLPETSQKIFAQLNCDESRQSLNSIEEFGTCDISPAMPEPLFARIDLKNLE
jgi:methionyl-tRNA synthetase